MECVSRIRGCELDSRCTPDQMKQAFRKAEEYDANNNPYGFPAFPYLWRAHPDTMAIDMEMGYRGRNRYVAQFRFQPEFRGVRVHTAVWIIRPTSDPSIAGFAALPSKDTRLHAEAVHHLKGLMGRPTAYTLVQPLDGEMPPPPPIDS